jgi:hypothetical protein
MKEKGLEERTDMLGKYNRLGHHQLLYWELWFFFYWGNFQSSNFSSKQVN